MSPHRHTHLPTNVHAGLAPVPVSFFLSPGQPRRADESPTAPVIGGVPAPLDWCGLHAREVAHLVARLTHHRDVVVDLDDHPLITRAARYLGRQPARLDTEGDRPRLRPAPPARRLTGRRDGAGLVTVKLPRAGAYSLDPYGMTRAMQSWRRPLRPGGFLLTALTAGAFRHGPHSHRSTVIAAAQASGMSWHQEFVVALVPLPEHEPRALPDTPTTCAAVPLDDAPDRIRELVHKVVHVRLLAFRDLSGGERG